MTSKVVGMTAAVKKLYSSEFENGQTRKNSRLDRLKKTLEEFKVYLKENPWALWTTRVLTITATALILWGVIYFYNLFSTCQNYCELYHSEVGVEFRRRQNLIPNLVLCVNEYAVHEKGIMKHVADARQLLAGPSNLNIKIDAARQMEGTLSKLLAVVEQYPNLKASEPTQTLIKEVANTENRIADWKMKYNESARAFNNLFTNFPSNYLGYLYGYRKQVSYIKTDEDLIKMSVVKFGEGNGN